MLLSPADPAPLEQKGLVSPQRTRGNTRMYSQADIERLQLINELTDEGINLAGVYRILDLKGRLDERDDELDALHRPRTQACPTVYMSSKPGKASILW